MQLSDDDVLTLAACGALERLPTDGDLRARLSDARHDALAREIQVDGVHLAALSALEAIDFADHVRRSSGEAATMCPLNDCEQHRQLARAGLISLHTSARAVGYLITPLGRQFLRRSGEPCAHPCGFASCGESGALCRRGRAL